jgi:hypothetical protein
LIGERGPELVIPNYIYTSPKFANVMAMLEGAIYSKQFKGGGNTASKPNIGWSMTGPVLIPNSPNNNSNSTNIDELLLMAITKLDKKLDEPFPAYILWDQTGYDNFNAKIAKAKKLGTF